MSLETGAAHTSDSCNSTGQFLMIIVINDHSQSRNNATLMIVRAHQMAQKTMHGTAGVTRVLQEVLHWYRRQPAR